MTFADIRNRINNGDYKSNDDGYLLFREDAHVAFNAEVKGEVTDNQFDTVFYKAWEFGHSSGYSEVLYYLDELLDIVKAFKAEEAFRGKANKTKVIDEEKVLLAKLKKKYGK